MNSSVIWKIVLSAIIVAWAVLNLVPYEDTPFEEYIATRATSNQAEYEEYLALVDERVANGTPIVLALKDVAREEEIDLHAEFFPDVNLVEIKNIDRRNSKMVEVLYAKSRGKLRKGLDLAGGVAFTLRINEDKPLQEYITAQVAANDEAYAPFLKAVLADANESGSFLESFEEVANQQQIDLQETFFPEIELAPSGGLVESNGQLAITLEEAYQDSLGASGKAQLEETINVMRQRIDGLGVAEPIIRPIGSNQIEVQLPGLDLTENPDAAEELKKPARLEFRLVNRDVFPGPGVATPLGDELMSLEEEEDDGSLTQKPFFVKIIPEADGDIVKEAYSRMNQMGNWEIGITMTRDGGDVFADITTELYELDQARGDVGRLAIVLDGKLYSAIGLRQGPEGGPITGGHASITGQFTKLEADELANVLNNPLKYELEVGEQYEVSPTIAGESRESSIDAAMLGAGLVMLFMLVYYVSAGIVAVISVGIAVVTVLGVLMSVGGTLTLPGVSALVLTIGMAVDANILIFERIREELRAGKALKTALQSGYQKAFSTIVDANVTTLITAAILMYLGTGPVKGFGLTLAIGIGASMFGALVVSRFMLEILVNTGITKKLLPFSLLKETKISFLSFRKPAFLVSWLIVIAGIFAIYTHKDSILGIDFRGGVEVTMTFEGDFKPSSTEIENIAASNELGEVQSSYLSLIGEDSERLKLQIDLQDDRATEVIEAMQLAFPDANLTKISENVIGASVSDSITKNAFISIVVALCGILLYVALRFEFGYGIGAVVATIHDMLMSIGIFVVLGQYFDIGSGQFTAPMVAAVLMILGYSINDTIVVFDRIREELDLNPEMKLFDVINLGLNRTLSRTLLTSITTLLAAISLYVFGAGIVTDFALIFIIGIITGTFSSIFIASPVFYWWHKGDRDHVTEHHLTRPTYEWETTTRKARDDKTNA